MLRRTLLSLLLAGIPFGFVSAAPMTMQFETSGFAPLFGSSSNIPADPVSGIIKWDAASPNAPVDQLTSINLNIGNHQYTKDEIQFFTLPTLDNPDRVGIGGKLSGDGLTTQANDFLIMWLADTLSVELFQYTVPAVNDVFFAQFVDSFSVTADATGVPEPATGALLGLALGGLALMRRRSAS